MHAVLSFFVILIASVVGLVVASVCEIDFLGVAYIFAIAAAGACIVGAIKSKK